MKYYVVIDTNVLVSAMLKWDSVPGEIIEFAVKGIIKPVLNEEIVAEYRTVLSRKKFHLTNEIVDAVINGLLKDAVILKEEHLHINLPDPKDTVFYEVVMEERKCENAYLTTGNIKHFPVEPFIVTPRQLLDIITQAK